MYLFNDNNQTRNGNACTCRRKRGMKHCVKEMKGIKKTDEEREDEDIIVYRREITQQYLVNDEEVVVSHFAAVVAEDIAVSE